MAMINCQDCNKEISGSAPSCPNCGRPNILVVQKKRSVSFLLGIGILILPMIFSWFTLRRRYSALARIISFSWLVISLAAMNASDGIKSTSISSQAPAEVTKTEQVIQVQIREILSAYENNEVGADNKYKGKLIEVTGIVDDIKKDFMDNLYVKLGMGQQFEFRQIQAFFDDSMNSPLSQLSKGERLTVICRVDGLIMMTVIAKKCVLK